MHKGEKEKIKADRIHIVASFFIFLSLSICFVHFTLYDAEIIKGIYVSAFLLWGGKSILFLLLLFISVILSFFHQRKRISILQLFLLLLLMCLVFYWTEEMKVVLGISSTNQVKLHVSFGFIATILLLLFLIIRLFYRLKKM